MLFGSTSKDLNLGSFKNPLKIMFVLLLLLLLSSIAVAVVAVVVTVAFVN